MKILIFVYFIFTADFDHFKRTGEPLAIPLIIVSILQKCFVLPAVLKSI